MTSKASDGSAVDPSQLLYLGEEGEWLGIDAHVDLDEFAKAADARVRSDDPSLSDDELPSGYGEPRHEWYRPMTRDWFDEHTKIDDQEYADQRFADFQSVGALEPCTADAPGAQAWTIIETGA